MESHLQENFDVRSKHSSAEVLERWRNLCLVVKNPRRRFRCTANLSKRHAAEAMRKTNQEKLKIAVLVSKAAIQFHIALQDNFEANAPSPFLETKSATPLLPETEINHVSHCIRNDSSEQVPFKANAPSTFPETKSSTPLLSGTEINQEAHHIRNDSSQKDSTEEENIDDIHPPHGSPTDSEHYGCTDVDQRRNIRLKKLELSLVVANLVCEVSTVIFDQLSSPHKSHFALIATLTSFFTIGFCIIEICCKCSRGKYVWKMEGKFYWFYNAADGKPFGSVLDIIGIVSGTLQFILTAVAYGIYYSQHVNSPIKLHIGSIVFAFVLLCSKIIVEKQKTGQHFESSEC